VKFAAALALAAGLSVPGRGQEVAFEDCIPKTGETLDFTAEHGGRVYALRSEACRELFLTDPERYAQLYEALQELARSGEPAAVAPGDSVSLVPS
jgi:YHS domain-containing protein